MNKNNLLLFDILNVISVKLALIATITSNYLISENCHCIPTALLNFGLAQVGETPKCRYIKYIITIAFLPIC